MRRARQKGPTGLYRFLSADQQQDWLDGKTVPQDAGERPEQIEQRFKYAARFQKLLNRPEAQAAIGLLQLYGGNCLPIPRRTERFYWSVSCLPSTGDKPLIRVNASWMELFTLYPDASGVRARFILHLSTFTTNGAPMREFLDEPFLEQCVTNPEDISHFFPRGEDMIIINIRGASSIREFLANPRAVAAIRTLNLTHMNRGRNAYQASHCCSLADCFLDP